MMYMVPVNLEKWDMFNEITEPGQVVPVPAVKEMKPDDIVLLHVSRQDNLYESGVYAYGKVLKDPFILEGHPEDFRNGGYIVPVRIDWLHFSHNPPIITHVACMGFTSQFSTISAIDPMDEDFVRIFL